MIAIGGAIGTGLFLGAGGRLAPAGPALVFAYALCGFFAFLVLRALGELVMHRPSSGSFVSYAREFFGEKAAFTAGWLYWLNWAMTADRRRHRGGAVHELLQEVLGAVGAGAAMGLRARPRWCWCWG